MREEVCKKLVILSGMACPVKASPLPWFKRETEALQRKSYAGALKSREF
jgi:hypothetical protein